VIRIADGAGDSIILERFRGSYDMAPDVRIEHATKRAVILKNFTLGRSDIGSYRNTPGAGPLFLEDVVGSHWMFTKQAVYAKQFNVEGYGLHVRNDGGTLRILGFKTEGSGTLIETLNGGTTEVLGAFVYCTAKKEHSDPMFSVVDSAATIIAGETCFTKFPFPIVVRETRSGVVKELARSDAKGRPNGSVLAPYRSGN
jgi:hypothetical protein